MALGTVEAFLVPHGAFGKLLFGGKYHATATRATLASWCLDSRRIRIVKWPTGRNFFLPKKRILSPIFLSLKSTTLKTKRFLSVSKCLECSFEEISNITIEHEEHKGELRTLSRRSEGIPIHMRIRIRAVPIFSRSKSCNRRLCRARHRRW